MDTLLTLLDYFEKKGWSSEYAFKLLVAQSSKMGDKEVVDMPCAPINAGIETNTLVMGLRNYLQLVDNICTSLAPFMNPGELEKMKLELLAIGQNH